MVTTSQLMTAEDLLRMPDDDCRYELVRGELRTMSPAGSRHGRIVINVTTPLDQHVRANNLGVVYAAETGFKIATHPDMVRAPDAAFVSSERDKAVGSVEGYWPGAPDLVVEVTSPGDLHADIEEKIIDWLDAGTRMVIIVNPRKRLATIYRSLTDITILTEQDTLDGADVVPGWTLPVRALFM